MFIRIWNHQEQTHFSFCEIESFDPSKFHQVEKTRKFALLFPLKESNPFLEISRVNFKIISHKNQVCIESHFDNPVISKLTPNFLKFELSVGPENLKSAFKKYIAKGKVTIDGFIEMIKEYSIETKHPIEYFLGLSTNSPASQVSRSIVISNFIITGNYSHNEAIDIARITLNESTFVEIKILKWDRINVIIRRIPLSSNKFSFD